MDPTRRMWRVGCAEHGWFIEGDHRDAVLGPVQPPHSPCDCVQVVEVSDDRGRSWQPEGDR